MGMVGAVLAPIGLFWMAFTTYREVPWILPIVASSLFGAAVYYIFTAVFTYLVTAYRPIAASAMASNTALRCCFAERSSGRPRPAPRRKIGAKPPASGCP